MAEFKEFTIDTTNFDKPLSKREVIDLVHEILNNYSSRLKITNNLAVQEPSKISFLSRDTGTPAMDFYRNIENLVFESPQNAGGNSIEFGSNTVWTGIIANVDDQFLVNNGSNALYVSSTTTESDAPISSATDTTVTAGGAKTLLLGSTGIALCVGSGAPTLSAPQGSLYLRTDGSSTSTRAYINTNGTTGWTAITTAS